MQVNVIAAKTAADSHTMFVSREKPVTVSIAGLSTGTEIVSIKRVHADGSEVTHKLKDGTACALTKDWTEVTIDITGNYKIDKPVTVESVSADVSF